MARTRRGPKGPKTAPPAPAAREDTSRSSTGRDLAALVALHAVLAALLFDPLPFTGGDNYWYMILAEGLRTGEGYRDFWLPGAPAHVRYPPLYPAVLAALGMVNSSLMALKLLSALFTTGAVALTYLAARRLASRRVALGVGMLLAAAPVVVEYSHWVLSEPLFLLLVTASLYGITRHDEAPTRGMLLLGVVAATAAALTRSAGYPLIAAVAVHLALRRRWGDVAWAVAIPLAGLGWWAWVKAGAASADIAYSQWLLYRNPYDPGLGTVGAGDLFRRGIHNLTLYPLTVLPQSVAGRHLGGMAAWMLGGSVTALALVGAWRGRRGLAFPLLFLMLYSALLLVWPEAWSDQRFLLPALPVVLLFAVVGLEETGPVLGRSPGASRWIGTAGLATLVVFAVTGNLRLAPRQVECTLRHFGGEQFACYPGPAVDFIRLAEWAGENTPEGAIIANRKPQTFYWYARRPGDTYAFSDDPASVLASLESMGARYVVVDTWFGTTARYLVPAIQSRTERFRPVHAEGTPQTLLLTFAPSQDAGP